jgi:hypothetical protein
MCSFFALAMAAGRVMGDGDYKDLHRRSAPRLTLHHRASTALSQGSQRRTTVSLCPLAVGWSVLGGEVHEGQVQRSLQRLAQKKCAATNLAS